VDLRSSKNSINVVVVVHPARVLVLHLLHLALLHLALLHLHQVPNPSGMVEGIAGTHVGARVASAIGVAKEMRAAVVVGVVTPPSAERQGLFPHIVAITALHSQAVVHRHHQHRGHLHPHQVVVAAVAVSKQWRDITFGSQTRTIFRVVLLSMASASRTPDQDQFVSCKVGPT